MIRKLKEELVNPEDLFKQRIDLAHQYQSDYNCFVTICDNYKFKGKKETLLTNIPYSLGDNYSTSGILTTASSNILKDYIPVYDATVYKKLKDSGATLVGKTTLDELGLGDTGTNSHTGLVKNPVTKERIVGGAASGSAVSVALGIVPFSIATDTNGSVRRPASYTGIVGFKPTYGRISRYGILPVASSLDHVGIFTTSVEDAAIVTDILKGPDKYDMTTLKDNNKNYFDIINNDIKGRKLCCIKEICNIDSYDNPNEELVSILKHFNEVKNKCEELGFEIEEVSLDKDLLEAIYPSYLTISCAEATSNNANLTGISFGNRKAGETAQDIMCLTRTEGFSELVKKRFILGSYVLQKDNQERLFLNAGRVRRIIVEKINDLFKTYDALLMPTIGIPPKINELKRNNTIIESQLIIANFGGYPSITIPAGLIDNMPVGINITGRILEDDVVLNIAYKIEQESRVGEINV